MIDKPKATASEAMGRKEVASELHIGSNICPECGNEIGESDPRRVYRIASGVMRLGHKGCADRYEAGEHAPAPPPPSIPLRATSINFTNFGSLQAFIIERREPIPSEIRVTIGDIVLQEGRER